MNVLYQELIARIRGEVSDLVRVVQKAQQAWPHAQTDASAQEIYLDSVALNLHGLYAGLKRLFELIARHVDQSLPNGETWHRDLLRQMAKEIPLVRPAVISVDNAQSLDEFRRFRHLVRNVYTIYLEPERLTGLMSHLPDLWHRVQAELLAFASFLEDVAKMEKDE